MPTSNYETPWFHDPTKYLTPNSAEDLIKKSEHKRRFIEVDPALDRLATTLDLKRPRLDTDIRKENVNPEARGQSKRPMASAKSRKRRKTQANASKAPFSSATVFVPTSAFECSHTNFNFTAETSTGTTFSGFGKEEIECSGLFANGERKVSFMAPFDFSETATPTRPFSSQELNKQILTDSLNLIAQSQDQISDNLEAILATSKTADLQGAYALRNVIQKEDVSGFDESMFSWVHDLNRENILETHRSTQCLDHHPDISAVDRWIVVNWMREVMSEYKCKRIAFHASVQFFDILLTQENVDKTNMQLAGISAILIGLKTFNPVQLPSTLLLEYLQDEQTMTPKEIFDAIDSSTKLLLKNECKLLKVTLANKKLDFDMFLPTPVDFLQRYFQISSLLLDRMITDPTPQTVYIHENEMNSFFIAKFSKLLFAQAASVLDQAVLDYESLRFSPSKLAATVFWKVIKGSPLDCKKTEMFLYNLDLEPLSGICSTSRRNKCLLPRLLYVTTGYFMEQLEDCIKFMEPYQPINIEEMLKNDHRIDIIQRWAMEGTPFRLEEDQLSDDMDETFYGCLY